MRVPGAVEAGWLAVFADRLAWPASSVTVSVIVLGLSRWLVTCFFGCSGARDTSTLCDLRVPGALECRSCRYVGCPGADVVAWFAESVAICVSPVILCASEFRSCRYVGCPGADVVAWFAESVAICVSPVIFWLAGWLAWLTGWLGRLRLSRSRSSSWV